jgi:hypothetical protein
MVDVKLEGDRVIFEIEGWDKLWALKSRLEIPLDHIKSVKVDDDAAKGWWHGVKLGGADLPGVITAGTFYAKGRLVFFDTHAPDNTIVVELDDHEKYDRLILQVADPAGTVLKLNQILARRA